MESSFFIGIGIGRVDSPFWDAIGVNRKTANLKNQGGNHNRKAKKSKFMP